MNFEVNVEVNPGENARFMAELAIRNGRPGPGYKGLTIGWWILRPFNNWLWDFHRNDGKMGWTYWMVRCLGLEICWEHRRK